MTNDISSISKNELEKQNSQNESKDFISSFIDCRKANYVILPELKFTPTDEYNFEYDNNIQLYYETLNKAKEFYKNKLYSKAKIEFLKIHTWQHRYESFFIDLLRTYRKLVDLELSNNNYSESINIYEEMFEKCHNYTNTDIKKYKKLIFDLQKQNIFKNEKQLNDVESEFTLDSNFLKLVKEIKKQNKLYYDKKNIQYENHLISNRIILPNKLSYISFDNNELFYIESKQKCITLENINKIIYSIDENHLLILTYDYSLGIHNLDFQLIIDKDLKPFINENNKPRCINISKNRSNIIFTIIDKVYVLDGALNLLHIWQVPYIEGFEKRFHNSKSSYNSNRKQYLDILGLDYNPTFAELKFAFRENLFKFHPDLNPNFDNAEERTKEIIEAYENLLNEFPNLENINDENDDFKWIDTRNVYKFESNNRQLFLNVTIGSGEDWIYGTGFSDDCSHIYLGCHSGILYQIDKNGNAINVYKIPQDLTSGYGKTNPITNILEYNSILYIFTNWYLYIIDKSNNVKHLRNDNGSYKFYQNGIILIERKQIKFFDKLGNYISLLKFKSNIMNVCYEDEIFMIETSTKLFTFKLLTNQSDFENTNHFNKEL